MKKRTVMRFSETKTPERPDALNKTQVMYRAQEDNRRDGRKTEIRKRTKIRSPQRRHSQRQPAAQEELPASHSEPMKRSSVADHFRTSSCCAHAVASVARDSPAAPVADTSVVVGSPALLRPIDPCLL